MTSLPPVLPEITFARVERLGRLHGTCVTYVAGFFALIAAMAGDYVAAIVGLLVAGAGVVEHHGAALLRRGEARGVSWLAGSQLFLFASIAAYCVVRLKVPVQFPPLPESLRPMVEMSAAQMKMSVADYQLFAYRLGLWLVLGLSVFYQGGLGWYYLSRRARVEAALAEPAEPDESESE